MKRGQTKLSFGMIFSIILIIAFIAFSFYVIKLLLDNQARSTILIFKEDLQSDVDKIWKGTGSLARPDGYRLPKKIKYVCIVDYSSNKKGINKELYEEFKQVQNNNDNFYFYPIGSGLGLDSSKINHIDLEKITETENPYCFENKNKVMIRIKRNYNETLVLLKRIGSAPKISIDGKISSSTMGGSNGGSSSSSTGGSSSSTNTGTSNTGNSGTTGNIQSTTGTTNIGTNNSGVSQTTSGTGDCSSFTVSNEGSDYTPLYDYSTQISFCSNSTSLGGNYETNVYPCISRPYIYKYFLLAKGFKELHNLNDPKILCGEVYKDYTQCKLTEAWLSFSTVNGPRKGMSGSGTVKKFPDKFRIFIPPGMTYAGVTLFFPIDAKEGIIVRYKKAPDATYLSYANGDYNQFLSIPGGNDLNMNLATLKQKDFYPRNAGGHAYALPAVALSSELSIADSGWLYIRKLPFSSHTIDEVKVTMKVDINTYLAWYNKVKPCEDSNQDSSAGYCWDKDGNPKEITCTN